MLADFTITTYDGRKPMAIRIKVHNSTRALRAAATRFDRRRDKPNQEPMTALGICHRFHLADTDVVALIRLAPPHIGIGVLSHEITHAAVWMWEIQHKFSKKTPINCENDEWFCWILGELVSSATQTLYDLGVYSR